MSIWLMDVMMSFMWSTLNAIVCRRNFHRSEMSCGGKTKTLIVREKSNQLTAKRQLEKRWIVIGLIMLDVMAFC